MLSPASSREEQLFSMERLRRNIVSTATPFVKTVYCTRDRRRWTRMNSTTQKSTPATTRMSVTVSIA
jgi:hypothetical protein